jgi:serine phosphatase RsbU (regulator of sigma subunit)
MNQFNDLEFYKNQVDFYKQTLMDSINYAKRIQTAIMHSEEELKKSLPNIFIMHQPKDIIGGDFYWLSKKDKHKLIIAAADGTGHGIPGALLSMLGVSFLNEIVNTLRIYEPAEILNSLRERIIKTLRQTGKDTDTQDAIDIALVTIDKKGGTVEFAGSYSPLYLVRSNNIISNNGNGIGLIPISEIESDNKFTLFEIKGDKMPTGISLTYGKFEKSILDYPLKRKLFLTKLREDHAFKNNTFKYFKNDAIYLFSDGYKDQFGGAEGKRFKSRGFKKLLLSIQDKSMEEQLAILNSVLSEWKAHWDQTDDILVIGVKL